MALPRRMTSSGGAVEALSFTVKNKKRGMILALLLVFLAYRIVQNTAYSKQPGDLLTTMITSNAEASSKQEFSKNEQTYDAKYWEYQAEMNKFGAAYKGDIIRHLMGVYPTVTGGKTIHTLLEFGCSGGYILDSMKKKKTTTDNNDDDLKLYGVEINPASRAFALGTFANTIQDVFLRPEDIPSSLNFDVIYTTSVLEHADCPLCELRKLYTKLHSDGLLIVGLKNDGADLGQTFAKYQKESNHHIYTWNPLLLANILNSAGFQPCHVIGQFDAWHAIDVPTYGKDKHAYCIKGLDTGKRQSVHNLWAVAVKGGGGAKHSIGACSAYKARLNEILNCQYLESAAGE